MSLCWVHHCWGLAPIHPHQLQLWHLLYSVPLRSGEWCGPHTFVVMVFLFQVQWWEGRVPEEGCWGIMRKGKRDGATLGALGHGGCLDSQLWVGGSSDSGSSRTHCVAENCLVSMALLIPPSECYSYRQAPLCQVLKCWAGTQGLMYAGQGFY